MPNMKPPTWHRAGRVSSSIKTLSQTRVIWCALRVNSSKGLSNDYSIIVKGFGIGEFSKSRCSMMHSRAALESYSSAGVAE